ncbi:metal transporter [Defluviimonas sp. WL0024]|uniref:Metal transporter n=2 Tax=Albidovulum TaxID=205889 RepID=A0ABT3J4T2_9RHOB|nr:MULTISPECIES: metal transporter [Defluviimonas]MCU9849184.1 metal transporter [Defluviimonas sp. WL0024]MCW3782689.1 metal transporter [Defluviimonas salinarum]
MQGRWTLILPFTVVALLVAGFLTLRPFSNLTAGVPPIEDLTFESVRLDETGIHALVRAAGSEPVVIAQVQVDGAFWRFTQTPAGPVPRLGQVALDIPYPWVDGEAHLVTLLTRAGAAFEHEIAVAVSTAPLAGPGVLSLIGVGLFVGFVPVLVGYGFVPALRAFGGAGLDFALALTLALLAFLLIDTWSEASELAAEAPAALNPVPAIWTAALLTCLGLLALGRRSGRAPEGIELAFFIALGIGVHNLGEGIAIGASVAVGEVALASFLVLGFFVHNVSEGIAIAAPVAGRTWRWPLLLGLALLAGGPAAIGTLAGVFAFTPFRAALALAVGAGAIAQVMFEIARLMLKPAAAATGERGWRAPAALYGFGAGLAVMYLTSILVAA